MGKESLTKVSALCPTFGRETHGPRLYDVFNAQTYENRELLILDDSETPSRFFLSLNDIRVRYYHVAARYSLGAKRNWLAENAKGQILAHFDDDDYYAPNYLTTMVSNLGDSDLIKLSSFYLFSLTHQAFAYWDLNQISSLHFRLESMRPVEIFQTEIMQPAERELWQMENFLGYGFSCVYRKSLWEQVPFDDARHGEDLNFVKAAMQVGASVRMPSDHSGLALVMRHSTDNSVVYPQYLLPPHTLGTFFGERGKSFVGYAADRNILL
ncbi:MAG: glycosyltransferase family 2 protein [Chitinophagia bacterium]|nr:glycosyltransferase family 2 protein [Chitinophagia bacterium]